MLNLQRTLESASFLLVLSPYVLILPPYVSQTVCFYLQRILKKLLSFTHMLPILPYVLRYLMPHKLNALSPKNFEKATLFHSYARHIDICLDKILQQQMSPVLILVSNLWRLFPVSLAIKTRQQKNAERKNHRRIS